MLKLQAKAYLLAFKALLLMTNLAVSLRFIFWRKRWMNSQTPSMLAYQVRREKTSRFCSSPSSLGLVHGSAASTMRKISLWAKRRRVVRGRFEAELRWFIGSPAKIKILICPECLKPIEIAHHYCPEGKPLVVIDDCYFFWNPYAKCNYRPGSL